ncbi:MAG: heat-inducible transcription repressor HrcA [Magnetococcales bacterium]|nr:heat-inducible transcription repressor HrcA [Magnetococcales bacterium]
MLTQRQHDVLEQVVRLHIEEGGPVSSSRVRDLLREDLSAATVRGVMAELIDMGFLQQPHTSAGRVPTERAYRRYVEGLQLIAPIARNEANDLQRACRSGGEDMHLTLQEVSRTLALSTDCTCMVRPPSLDLAVLKRIQFIKLSGGRNEINRILVLLVSHSGQIQNRIVPVRAYFVQKELDSFCSALNRQFSGMRLAEIRAALAREVTLREKNLEALRRKLLDTLLQGTRSAGLIINGQLTISGLDATPAFAPLGEVREKAVIQEKKRLMQLLDGCLEAEGVRWFIGVSPVSGKGENCSVVAAKFAGPESAMTGSLGLVGPLRLDYAHIIPLVKFTAELLTRYWSGTLVGEEAAGEGAARLPPKA